MPVLPLRYFRHRAEYLALRRTQGPHSSQHVAYLVLDTNVLLGHLDVLQQFVDDVERTSAPVIVIVPGVVLSELDGYVSPPWTAQSLFP